MEALVNYIKRNVKLAVKTVFFNFRQYSWFFAAMLIIQVFVGTMSLAALNNDTVGYELVKDEYDCHLILKNINADQYLLLENDNSVKFESSRFFHITNVSKHGNEGSFDLRYDVSVRFNGDPEEAYGKFTEYFGIKLAQYNPSGNWSEYKTPLLEVNESKQANLTYYIVFLCAATLLSCAFLYSLYSIWTNYFRFTYGIFMSFGGGFAKIFSTSFWEMMCACVVCAIPSSLISYVCAAVIYVVTGVAFTAHFSAYVIALAVSMLVSALSLVIPCKRISRKTPVSNIIAEDNSNLVTSPRNSFEFWKVSIPKKYEAVTLLRFRKYNIRLVLTSVIFCCLFVFITSFSDLYAESISVNEPQFTISFTDNTPEPEEEDEETDGETTTADETSADSKSAEDDKNKQSEADTDDRSAKDTTARDEKDTAKDTASTQTDTNKAKDTSAEKGTDTAETQKADDGEQDPEEEEKEPLPNYVYTEKMDKRVQALEGITCIQRVIETSAAECSSHVVVDDSMVRASARLLDFPNDSGCTVFNNVYYSPCAASDMTYLERFDFDGDLTSVYKDKKTVIVSDSFNNARQFNYKVGDTVRIAKLDHQIRPIDDWASGEYLLRRQLKYCRFTYEEYTVGAVIHGAATDANTQIYMSEDDYLYQTGFTELPCRTVNIWTRDTLSNEDTDALEGQLAEIIKPYANGSVTSNHAHSDTEIEASKNKFVIYRFVGILTLCIAPLLWMFSQRMFYIKRRDEFLLLKSLGTSEGSIRAILRFDALVLGAAAAAVYIAATPIGVWALRTLANRYATAGGTIRYTSGIPLVPYLCGLLVICAASFASSAVSYWELTKRRRADYKITINTINSEYEG